MRWDEMDEIGRAQVATSPQPYGMPPKLHPYYMPPRWVTREELAADGVAAVLRKCPTVGSATRTEGA